MEDVNVSNDYFINPDGIKLFRIIYQSTIEPMKAIVFVCHGLFEHCQADFDDTIIKPFTAIGCMVITHDHRGHGKSEGERGMVYNIETLVRDVLLDIDDVIEKKMLDKELPIFIYGHSMGGLISVYAVLERKQFFKGVCLEAPALGSSKYLTKVVKFIAQGVNKVFPHMTVGKAKKEDFSRNMYFVNETKNDELRINRGIPARTGVTLLDSMEKLIPLLKDVTTPFFIGHGDADKICNLSGSQYFMEVCPIEDKTLIVYPNARHMLRRETENVDKEFCKSVVDWIDFRIS